ncbi:hypothetical protein PUNSTDRAFT_138406 [Punctularia strigosozonata HHB-11173 SS5]|uniref:Uncharacterized protein n=1 Tax=Punctularia strigosozonata (strain HHB-11173) TaxID=741275 RepID=R7S5N2_PUNST|nr:uncharacterized protein PUNSTDRAFT_138406 [Punctularia strigosozonata HHB-11173 SS5]EIN04761.1 hypothetical protein PUNSTDRAFT_138406 [Punctularia strigosozonata HHB-11173 SS5]
MDLLRINYAPSPQELPSARPKSLHGTICADLEALWHISYLAARALQLRQQHPMGGDVVFPWLVEHSQLWRKPFLHNVCPHVAGAGSSMLSRSYM